MNALPVIKFVSMECPLTTTELSRSPNKPNIWLTQLRPHFSNADVFYVH